MATHWENTKWRHRQRWRMSSCDGHGRSWRRWGRGSLRAYRESMTQPITQVQASDFRAEDNTSKPPNTTQIVWLLMRAIPEMWTSIQGKHCSFLWVLACQGLPLLVWLCLSNSKQGIHVDTICEPSWNFSRGLTLGTLVAHSSVAPQLSTPTVLAL